MTLAFCILCGCLQQSKSVSIKSSLTIRRHPPNCTQKFYTKNVKMMHYIRQSYSIRCYNSFHWFWFIDKTRAYVSHAVGQGNLCN